MARLADYVIIVGYNHENNRGGVNQGKILQRFPEKDWDDASFIEGVELFCQPHGWMLSTEQQEPKFFISVLTDIDANRRYCACLSFNEAAAVTPSKIDEEEDADIKSNIQFLTYNKTFPSITHHSIMYAPKCIVLISRLNYPETFRNCLGILYTVFIENVGLELETLIGNLLGCVYVPPPGGPEIRFSIGAGDRQALQPPLSGTLPVTNSTVTLLFHQLSIKSVITVFCAALTEHKVLFHSSSYSRLTDACHALTSLMYPFRYSHVYIPVLPTSLVEVLSTPTPFVMGVHSSMKQEIEELLDVIVADLDGGALTIPENLTIPQLPEPLYSMVHETLCSILQPELHTADWAFPPSSIVATHPAQLDKEVRAVFIRMLAQLLQGYRHCLNVLRIHPKLILTFHKAAFLGHRGLTDCDFTNRVLDCMFFNAFITERGPSWRVCDVWDDVYSSLPEQLKQEAQDSRLVLSHVRDIAQQLYNNENPNLLRPNTQPYAQKIPKPTEGAFTRIHQPVFPVIDPAKVQRKIDEGAAKGNLKAVLATIKPASPRFIPAGPPLTCLQDPRHQFTNSARRLEVLRNCVNCIFDNKISEARKSFPAVLRAFKSESARLALCMELSNHVGGSRAVLDSPQFDLVIRLMNCALQNGSSRDEFGVAAALLPLATAFCRKLCTGVVQFAYTCIQDHQVWQSQQFWEAAFFQDVQKDIRALFLSRNKANRTSPEDKGPSVLDIAAEQARLTSSYNEDYIKEIISNEESTIYSQAIHYANRMVYLLVPLEAVERHRRVRAITERDSVSNSMTNSAAESEVSDSESGFGDAESSDVGTSVVRFISRFIDKVCNEGGVTAEHVRALHQMIPGVVAMHLETLETVHREAQRLPPVQKSKILMPNLLSGEELILEGLRVYLLPDGREEGPTQYNLNLLPAEGALFLTNYRIVFKGTPCDPLACEQLVTRSFPITSLTKEKRVSDHYVAHMDQWLKEGLQLRSSTFQLIKVAFDEEVTLDSIDVLRKYIHRCRYPASMFSYFAFTGQVFVQATPLHKNKEKSATLKGIAKKTLLKTARQVGFKTKTSTKRHKYVVDSQQPKMEHDIKEDDDLSDDDGTVVHQTPQQVQQADPKTLERAAERKYCRDFQRIGIVTLPSATLTPSKGKTDSFRVTTLNSNYGLCRSYPALLVVPAHVSDESLRRVARFYRHGRFPVITWRHPRTKALLLRGSTLHAKGVMGILRGGNPNPSAGPSDPVSASFEQERYFGAIVSATPIAVLREGSSWAMSDSTLSITSLVLAAGSAVNGSRSFAYKHSPTDLTPEVNRKSSYFGQGTISKAMNTLRHTSSRGPKSFMRKEPDHDNHRLTEGLTPSLKVSASPSDRDSPAEGGGQIRCSALYIFGEKNPMKAMRADAFPKTDFIPIDYPDPRSVRNAFKKLMRACVPSSHSAEPEKSFYRAVENSEWLQQLSTILQVSGAIVDLMDSNGSSVSICLEDGWDTTAQLVSIAQLCLDPYYRTVEGFRVLVEKEWLAFGHRFSHRSNLNATSQSGGFTPIFLQFLDLVHQLLCQFPMAFEFNHFHVKFIAYHHVSCRFRTFLLDSECERVEAGIMAAEDKKGSLSRHHRSFDTPSDDESIFPGGRLAGSGAGTPSLGQSIFDYIEKQSAKSPVFYNFFYSPDPEHQVLRPYSGMSNLQLWDFYVTEELFHGTPYDLEVTAMDLAQAEEARATEGPDLSGSSKRRVIIKGYDSVLNQQPESFGFLVEEIRKFETELGHLPQKWRLLWDKLEQMPQEKPPGNNSSVLLARAHARDVHKRCTIEILLRGRAAGTSAAVPASGIGMEGVAQVYSSPHRFEKYNYTTPTYCDYCAHILWGIVKTGMRCVDCGYNCHEKCIEHVPKHCSKYRAALLDGAGSSSSPGALRPGSLDVTSVSSSGPSRAASSQRYYDQFSANIAENRTHEGYLFKRGALLKAWKQRWFVLDSVKHQLRYYDSMEDSSCKGFIDLAEVTSVYPAGPSPGAPKKVDDKAFFDLTTRRRAYNFCATDAPAAQEWIEKIQACLQ